jgi:hypothetical protein
MYVHCIFPPKSPPFLWVTTDLYRIIGPEDTLHLHISKVSAGLSNGLVHFRCFYFRELAFLAVNGTPTPPVYVLGVYFVINFLLLIGKATAVTALSRPIEQYHSRHSNL